MAEEDSSFFFLRFDLASSSSSSRLLPIRRVFVSCSKSSSSSLLVQPSRSSLCTSSLCVVVDNFCKEELKPDVSLSEFKSNGMGENEIEPASLA